MEQEKFPGPNQSQGKQMLSRYRAEEKVLQGQGGEDLETSWATT